MRILTLLIFCAGPVLADDPENGRRLFEAHCAVCHGTDATGGGPMASVLSIPPADLTSLSDAGDFPTSRVLRRITGEEMEVHGGPMPLFGLILEGPSEAVLLETGDELIVPEAVADIAAWLETLNP